MRPFVDRATLEQTSFDSALPSGTATVVHRFLREGRYAVALSPDGKQVVETRTIWVEHRPGAAGQEQAAAQAGDAERPAGLEPPRPGADPSAHPMAITVDVGRGPNLLAGAPAPGAAATTALGAGGYASFSAATGAAHHIVVTRIGPGGEQDKEFDSTRLDEADIFAMTLFRPGTYAMRNAVGRHEGRLVVTYPEIGRSPYRPAEPVNVTSGPGGFEPASVTVGPGQGIIFHVAAASRITVDLLEPDDGPPERRERREPLARRRFRPVPRGGDGGPYPSSGGSGSAAGKGGGTKDPTGGTSGKGGKGGTRGKGEGKP